MRDPRGVGCARDLDHPTVLRLALALAVGACSSAAKKQMTLQEMIAADPLPLAKGAKWTYQSPSRSSIRTPTRKPPRSSTGRPKSSTRSESNGVTAFRVKGWPTDLASFDSGEAPAATERTLLRSGNNFLFGASPEPTLDGAEGWFSWPVIDGQKICPKAEMVYCWQVAAVETGYALSFYTGPDEQTFELEPGTGVSRFHYAHHGTTNEVDAKLKSYSKGRR